MTEFDKFVEGRMERLNLTHLPNGDVLLEPKEELLAVCDFCGRGANVPLQTHEAEDVTTRVEDGEPVYVSVGDWAGCDPCSDLIHRMDKDGLKQRALDFYLALIANGPFGSHASPWVVADMVEQAHNGFWRARKAPGQT